MSREQEYFRYHLADLRRAFPGKNVISKQDFADYLGVDRRTMLRWDIPLISNGRKQIIPIISAARWLSGGNEQ